MTRKKVITEDDFEELLRDGLSSQRSYIFLKQKNRTPVYLCFKPFLYRLSGAVVYVGGKLSAFPDKNDEKWTGISKRNRVSLLQETFKKLPHDRVSEERIGSNLGVYVAGGPGDGDKFIEKMKTTHLIEELVAGIESKMRIEISNRKEVKAFLNLYYSKHVVELFGDTGVSVSPRTVGKKSDLLLGQEHVGTGSSYQEFVDQYGLNDSVAA